MEMKTKWLIWLQFAILFLFLAEVNGKVRRRCRGLLRNIPAHTKIALKQRKANHITVVCDKGYYFSKGVNRKHLSCRILRKLRNHQIPHCRGCGVPLGLRNVRVRYTTTSVGSVAVYFCDVGFRMKGSRKHRVCGRNLQWSGNMSQISCQLEDNFGTSSFKPFDARSRVVGGKKADKGRWPWAVRIFIDGEHECGGSLINKEFVLTAAHCFNLDTLQLNMVKVSLHNRNLSCLALHIHHGYNKKDYRNDIALIQIPKLQHFTQNQQAICLPLQMDMTNIIKEGQEMYAVGWGKTTPLKRNVFKFNLDLSKNLKQVKLPFKTYKFCEDLVKNKTAKESIWKKDIWYFNNNTQFCAGDITGQNDTCKGDSGGPAMVFHVHPVSRKWRWFQVGIVSWGDGCAQKGEVGYYTKVSAYVDWISQIAQLQPKQNGFSPNRPDLSNLKTKERIKHKGGPLNLKYKGGLDLIFVLDTSSTVTRSNLQMAKGFMKEVVKIFGIDERAIGNGTHIACVTYGTRAQKEFTFNDQSVLTKEKALKRIDKISYVGGVTATRLALDMVRKVILPSSKRLDSMKALFLITDGEWNLGGSPKNAANILKKNVEIYAIGMGRTVRYESLRLLASHDTNVFVTRSYKGLNKVMKIIVNRFVKDYFKCGVSPFKPFDARSRIVGGIKANRRNWPWAVRVLVEDKPGCGGTLINQEFVLTAAHCFDVHNRPPIKTHEVKVLFQNKDIQTSLKLRIHPEFNKRNLNNDIALIQIPKLRRFTRDQQAICLPRHVNTSKIIKHDREMYVVGWGGTNPKKPGERSVESELSKDMKQVKLPFKTYKFCDDNVKNKTAKESEKYKDIWYFNSITQFCAGDITGQKGTCYGDSGGPGMVLNPHPKGGKWRWFQVGIGSWGYGCAQKGEAGYYTKVSAYLDWIDKIIKT